MQVPQSPSSSMMETDFTASTTSTAHPSSGECSSADGGLLDSLSPERCWLSGTSPRRRVRVDGTRSRGQFSGASLGEDGFVAKSLPVL